MQPPPAVDPATVTNASALWALVAVTISTLVAQVVTIVARHFEREQRRRWQEEDRAWRAALTTEVHDASATMRDLNRRVPSAAIRVTDVAAIVEQRHNNGERRHGDTRVLVARESESHS